MILKKNILICGGTYGLGFFIAQQFLKKNENVIIIGKNSLKLKQTKKKIKSNYITGIDIRIDGKTK